MNTFPLKIEFHDTLMLVFFVLFFFSFVIARLPDMVMFDEWNDFYFQLILK